MKIDTTDRKILNFLQENGRIAASHIADKLDISIPTVTERIKKLQESGIIQGIHAVLNPKKLELDISALITVISESSIHYKEFIKTAEKTPEVMQIFRSMMDHD